MISVITVNKDRVIELKNAVTSLLNQTNNRFEYIIIDGDSGKEMIGVLDSYRFLFEERNITYKYLSEPDEGIYDALNKGIKVSSGDWIGILHSDDLFEKNCLDLVYQKINSNPDADIIIGNTIIMDANQKKARLLKLESNNFNFETPYFAPHVSAFIKRSVFESLGYYDLKFKISGDQDFFARCLKSNLNFIKLDKILVRMSDKGISNSSIFRISYEDSLIIFKNSNNIFKALKYFIKIILIRTFNFWRNK